MSLKKRCAQCGRAFTTTKASAVTCSKICRQRRWRRQQAARREDDRFTEMFEAIANRRVTTRDGTAQADGLAPHGVQTLIPDGETTREREETVERVLNDHLMLLPLLGRTTCTCGGWSSGEPYRATVLLHRAHQAEQVIEALSWL